jgi:hypothetical protein
LVEALVHLLRCKLPRLLRLLPRPLLFKRLKLLFLLLLLPLLKLLSLRRLLFVKLRPELRSVSA